MFGFGSKSAPASRGSKDPAQRIVEVFTALLDKEGLKYSVSDSKPAVFLNYSGDNFKSLTFSIFVDDDGLSIAVRVFSILKFTSDQLPDAYEFCNRMALKYRWVHFYVDSDLELTAGLDAVISEGTAAAECLELLRRTVSIVDDVYGEILS